MNAARRKELAAAIALCEQADALLLQAVEIIEQAQTDELDYFDNMPESLQSGGGGERSQEAIDALQTALDDLAAFEIETVTNSLRDASQ